MFSNKLFHCFLLLYWNSQICIRVSTRTRIPCNSILIVFVVVVALRIMGTPVMSNLGPVKVEAQLLWEQFVAGIFLQLPPLEVPNPKDEVSFVRPFVTLPLEKPATKLMPLVIDPRRPKLVESTGRSRYYTTKPPPYGRDTISKMRKMMMRNIMMSKETINVRPDQSYYFGGPSRQSAEIDKKDLPRYRAHARHLAAFKTFLKERDAVHALAQKDPSFLVVTPHQLMAYPTMLPLFRNYGLQLIEPHYMFTVYLAERTKPIYFLKKKKKYKYSSRRCVMKTHFYERLLWTIMHDQQRVTHGYVMGGLSYVFNHSHKAGYKLLRNILSTHHRPDYIIHVMIPEDVVNAIPAALAFDPTTNYTILLHNYPSFKETIADKCFEDRILEEDVVTKNPPFCYSTEHGNVNYVTLLEWRTVKPKTIMLFRAVNIIEEEGVALFEQAGIAPDLIMLFTKDEYNFDFDVGNYLYDRFYVSFFTKTFPAKICSVFYQTVEREEIQDWLNLEPKIPYFECKYDKMPSSRKPASKENNLRNQWLLQIAWGDETIKVEDSYYGIREGYYTKHLESPVPSLEEMSKYANKGVKPVPDKLNLKDMEGRMEYFQNLKKLPLKMRDAPTTKDWGKVCPVSSMDEAMIMRGHYSNSLKFGDVIYLMRSKIAIYKFMNNPLYRRLQWAWWTDVHILIGGQPICGAKYVGTALAMILKAPHVYYDAIYKSALTVKRLYNHCFYMEIHWMRIWYYKWSIYTGIERERFKRFLPWALGWVKYVRRKACKGMDEPTINALLNHRCYYPYRRLSKNVLTNVFPRLQFEVPELETKFFNWAPGLLEGYVRVLDLIILHLLRLECPPLFLARLIYLTPGHLLPELFVLENPREVFQAANILHELSCRQNEAPTALEETAILNQAIYQAMAKRDNIPGEGWVVSGIKIYPNFIKRLNFAGLSQKVIYITDPTFHIFLKVFRNNTRKQTAKLAKQTSFTTCYMDPSTLKVLRREMVANLRIQAHMFPRYICPNNSACLQGWYKPPVIEYTTEKCICTDSLASYAVRDLCKNISIPKAMNNKYLANPSHSPIFDMLKNIAIYPGQDLTCFLDHRNLNYYDHHLPTKLLPMKLIGWKRTYCRRYVFDYFYKKASKEKYLHVAIELRHIRPRRFTEMITEITIDHMPMPEKCHCRLLCLCKPISLEEYGKFP